MKNILKAVAIYLKDWKNLLVHSLVGFGILGIAIFLPVTPLLRIAFLVMVIVLNVIRMRWERSRIKKADTI